METPQQVYSQAIKRGRLLHPDAEDAHHNAFANAVTYGVTACAGSVCEGPSMRERAARAHLYYQLDVIPEKPGTTLSFEDAAREVDAICYGPMTLAIARMSNHHCYGDTPDDKETAMHMLQA